MSVGAAGMAILFFMYLVATTIIGVFVAGYAAHSFLTVVEDTAAGNDEVRWPHDPLVDWAWKFVYLGWLMSVWLVPSLIVARFWAAGSQPETAFAKTAGIVAVLFWLFFPITLLSSLSASSRWFVFSPAILPRLAQRPGSVAIFYLLTGPLILAGVLAARALLIAGIYQLPLGAIGLTCVLLVYGRLFGRLALLLRHTRDPRTRPVPRPARRAMTLVEAADRVARPREGVIAAADLPPVNAPDEEARIGYDLRLDDPPSPSAMPEPPRPKPIDRDDVPYELLDREPAAVHRGPLPKRLLNPPEYELALARRGRLPEPPPHPWQDDVWTFPFYTESRRALVWLSFALMVLGVLFRQMLGTTIG
jgi:hypothetical protein